MKLLYFNTGIVHFLSQKCGIVHFTSKQLPGIPFCKDWFYNLPKEGRKQLIWNSSWVKNKHWSLIYSVVFLTQF